MSNLALTFGGPIFTNPSFGASFVLPGCTNGSSGVAITTNVTSWNVRYSDGSTLVVEAVNLTEARAYAAQTARWRHREWGAPEPHVIGVSEQ